MQGFTKLFSSIVDSTIWREDPYTKVVWITMLAKADRNGIVSCSLPGLADAARVTLKQCQDALVVFLSPDEFSRTKDFEGRRIMEVDGGWVLLNYMKFRAIQNEDEVRIATAERVRRHRAKFASQSDVTDVTDCNGEKRTETDCTPSNAIAEAEAEAEAEKKNTIPSGPVTSPSRAKKNHGVVFGNYPPELEEAYTIWRTLKKDMALYADRFKQEERCMATSCGAKEAAWTAWQKLTNCQVAGHGFITNQQILSVIRKWAISKIAKAKNGESLNYPMLSTMLNKSDFIDTIIREAKEEASVAK